MRYDAIVARPTKRIVAATDPIVLTPALKAEFRKLEPHQVYLIEAVSPSQFKTVP